MNWQFIPMQIVYTEFFEKGMIVAHLTLLLTFLFTSWTLSSPIRKLKVDHYLPSINWRFLHEHRLLPLEFNMKVNELDPTQVATILSTCNLIGMLCARGLHH